MKKKAIFVSLIVVLAIAMCALVGCGSSIRLVDFPATVTDEEQTLGDVYELRRTVEDEAGKSYNLSAEVKTAGGGLVNVVNSSFELTDPSGYVVTYTAIVGEKDTRTCVVTVPVVDRENPTVAIGNAANAVVGEKYTLPEVKFTDYTELVSTSVKVFYVTEDGETEIELKTEDGKYTFTPASVGTYRISATATDSAGNTTTRTLDFIADVILRGEIFRPDSLGARDQIRSSAANPTIEFVSDADNHDMTYGGAYWRVVPNETGWRNVFVTPRMSIENYEDFEFIAFWFYAESAGASAPFDLPILDDVDLKQTGVMSNTWTLIEIPTDKFVEKYEKYLFAISYSNTAITGARVGTVRGAYHSVVEVSEPVVGVVDGTEPATVTFTAGGKHGDDDIAVTAKVTDASGNEVTTFTENNGAYNYKISQVGEYTLTVTPADGVYVGSAVKTFKVKNANTIDVTEELSECVEQGVELDLPVARVLNNGLPTSDKVTVSVLEKAIGGDWLDMSANISDGKYMPSDLGELKVVYSFTGLEEVELTAQIVKRGEVFDPESAGARGQLRSSAASPTIEFVSADDNDDPTYGGAYWRVIPNATGWKNTFVTPRMNIENYAGYDAIAFWFYAESAGNSAAFNLPILNDAALQQQGIMSKTWNLIEIPIDKFTEKYTQYLFAINYSNTAITGARIGEIYAVKSTTHSVTNVNAGKVTSGAPAAVSFEVGVTPAEVSWTAAVTAPDGSAVTVNKTGNTVSFSAAAEGIYVYTITTMEGVYRKVTKGAITVASMTVEENEVFNPSSDYAQNSITAANSAFANTVKTVVTEEENTDTTYGGAYVKFTAVPSQWGRIALTPYYATDYYADYDYITAWVYVGQTADSAKTNMKLIYGNVAFMCGYVPTDEWVKVTIAKPYDGMTGAYADNVFFKNKIFGNAAASSFDMNNFFALKTTANTEYFAVGKIEAHKFADGEKTEKKFFDPAAENVADKIGRSVAADTIETDGVVNPDPEGDYKGAVVSWTPVVNTDWKNFYLHSTECDDVNAFYAAYGNCSAIKIWVYIKSTDSQTKNRNFEMLMFNAQYGRQKIVTDKWVEVTINMGGYIVYYDGNKNFKGNPNFFSQNAFAGETVYFGSATAVSYM